MKGQTANLRLDWVSYKAAKYACESWHYSGCVPTSKTAKIGVWENDTFIGVVIFGVGANNNLVKPYGLENTEGCELNRVSLRDHITPVTKIVSIAIKMIKKQYPGLKLIVSFADTDQKHLGIIYQAGNWIYTGTTPTALFPIINGKKRHPRVVSLMIKAGTLKSRDELEWIKTGVKHRYLYPLNDKIREEVLKLQKPYPKNASEA